MIHIETKDWTGILALMIPIVAIVGGICFAFAERYLKSKERMEMISRGMDVSAFKDADNIAAILGQTNKRRRRSPLRGGLVWLGVGTGLLVAYYLDHTVLKGQDNDVLYFGVTALFVGLGLIVSYLIEGKNPDGTGNQ